MIVAGRTAGEPHIVRPYRSLEQPREASEWCLACFDLRSSIFAFDTPTLYPDLMSRRTTFELSVTSFGVVPMSVMPCQISFSGHRWRMGTCMPPITTKKHQRRSCIFIQCQIRCCENQEAPGRAMICSYLVLRVLGIIFETLRTFWHLLTQLAQLLLQQSRLQESTGGIIGHNLGY